jgi:dGTPase
VTKKPKSATPPKPGSKKAADRAHFRSVILQEESVLSKYAARDKDAIRKAPLSFECTRPNYWRDADRILHSYAFNRFLDKTQVFYLNENARLTHRMLHVQLVAKISRLLARALRLNAHLCEAIALGHDIGHTPFGHEGESILSEISQRELNVYFKHSVQSVRFLNMLERNSQDEQAKNNGLNLTLQVLDGILCHDGESLKIAITPKREKTIEDFLRQFEEKKVKDKVFHQPKTLEGCLVRFCDVIGYIGRDIEDAIALGVIEKFPDTPLGNNNGQIIDTLVMNLAKNSEGKDKVAYSRPIFNALKDLYKFNYENIYKSELISLNKEKIERLFRMLYDEIKSDLLAEDRSSPIFKDHVTAILEYYPTYLEKTQPEQVVIDFMSGMTDRYFISLANEKFIPSRFPTSFSDLSRITGLPERYLEVVMAKRKKKQ